MVSNVAALASSSPDFRASAEYRQKRARFHIACALAILALVASIVLWVLTWQWATSWGKFTDEFGHTYYSFPNALWIAATVTSAFFGVAALFAYAVRAVALRDDEDRVDRERAAVLREERDRAAPASGTELAHLLEANRALLDEYQQPVRRQARTSYLAGQIAIFVGLGVLLLGVALTLAADNTAAQVGVAGLTAIGAALSGYIARTFLRVYERAQDQLNFYFREPLVTSYLLTAERLAEKLNGDRREEAHTEMIGEIFGIVRGDCSRRAN
jgi:hypothetical protein